MAATHEVYNIHPMSRLPMRPRGGTYASNGHNGRLAHLDQLSPLEKLRQDYQEKLLLEKEKKISDLYEKRNDEALAKVRKYSGKRNYSEAVHLNGTHMTNRRQRDLKNHDSYAESYKKRIAVSAQHELRTRKPQKLPPLNNMKKSTSFDSIRKKEPQFSHHDIPVQRALSERITQNENHIIQEEPVIADEDRRSSPPPNAQHLRLLRERRMRLKQLHQQDYNSSSPSNVAFSEKKLSDFEKWQQERDSERLARLQKHNFKQVAQMGSPDDDDKTKYFSQRKSQSSDMPHFSTKLSTKRSKSPIVERHPVTEKKRQEILRQGIASEKRIAELEKEIMQKQLDLRMIQERQLLAASASGDNLTSGSDSEHDLRFSNSYAPISKPVKVPSKKSFHDYKVSTTPYEEEQAEKAFQRKPVLVRRDASQGSSRGGGTPQRDKNYSLSDNGKMRKNSKPSKASKRKLVEKQPSTNPSFDDHASAYPIESITEEERNVVLSLVSCNICGRKFSEDRLAKHSTVCAKNQVKTRKVFDMTKARTQGTDAEKFVRRKAFKRSPSPPSKKSDWRRKHEDFINTIRNAKQVSDYIAKGGKVSDLPPPPPSENPDYVKCQYCQRRFNPTVAERHIPRCKDIKSRPKPPKRK